MILADEVCDVQNGCAFKSAFFNDTEGVPLIRIRDVHSGKSETRYSGPYTEEYVVNNGDLLVGMDGEFRVCKWMAGKALLNQRVCRLLPKGSDMIPDFLYYSIGAPLKHIEDHTPFTTVKHLAARQVRAITLPKPPLPEQRRIAHVLSTVQEAIAQQEKLIRTTTELKQALMQKLFTEGLRGEPLKETEIGMVPESWGIVSVGQLFYTQLGKMLSPKARTGSEPKPYLRNKNVQWDGIDTDDLYLMDFDDREMEKFRLEPGDLLVCEGGEVGRTALWRGAIEECYYQKALHRLRPRDGSIRPAFMAYWMRYAFQMHNIYGVTGTRTTIAHLPEIKLTPLTVPLPSIEEQDKMLAVLEGTDEKLDHTRHKLIALQALFRTLLHELMTGKVSVGEMN